MARRKSGMPKQTPDLSAAKLTKTTPGPLTRSGFCQWGPSSSHEFCVNKTCTCECHTTAEEAS